MNMYKESLLSLTSDIDLSFIEVMLNMRRLQEVDPEVLATMEERDARRLNGQTVSLTYTITIPNTNGGTQRARNVQSDLKQDTDGSALHAALQGRMNTNTAFQNAPAFQGSSIGLASVTLPGDITQMTDTTTTKTVTTTTKTFTTITVTTGTVTITTTTVTITTTVTGLGNGTNISNASNNTS